MLHKMPWYLLLWIREGKRWVCEGERPWWGLVCSLPPRWVLIAHGLLGEEGLGHGGREREGARLGQLRGPRGL